MVKKSLILALIFVLPAVLALPAEAKFRDVINFEDSQFVSMQNMEMFHRYQKFSDTEEDTFERTTLKYQLTYGVLKNFEVGIYIPVHFYEDGNNGIGDAGMYQKFLFTEQEEGLPRTSGGFELIFPTGDEDDLPDASDELDARLFFTVDGDFDQDWRWLANVAYRYYGQSEDDDRFEYNTALRVKSGPRLKFVGELNGHSGGRPDQSELYFAPGIIFEPREGFNFTVSAPFGIGGDAADHKSNFQFGIEF